MVIARRRRGLVQNDSGRRWRSGRRACVHRRLPRRIDPEDRRLVEGAEQNRFALPRGGDAAERLDDDAGVVAQLPALPFPRPAPQHGGWRGWCVPASASAKLRFPERRRIEPPVLRGFPGHGREMQPALRHADDRHVEVAALRHARSAGKIFCRESPVAPKNTKRRKYRSWCAPLTGTVEVTAELIAHRRQELVGEVRLAA